jgi:branched-chain amino acid transport system ATP-binding protein
VAGLMATLAALHRDGLSLLLVEQNATAALEIVDRAVVLETGRVRLQGSTKNVTSSAAVSAQPGLEILRSLEIEQGIGQGFKGAEG